MKTALESIVLAKRTLNVASFVLQSPGDTSSQRAEALSQCREAQKALEAAIRSLSRVAPGEPDPRD